MSTRTLKPKVNEVQEYIEIARDFANPLDLVREAISNAYDAGAQSVSIGFSVNKQNGEDILMIEIEDDGMGMNEQQLQSFFDLGNSMSKDDPSKIGEKGHGTKIYFNSKTVQVETYSGGTYQKAEMNNPINALYSGRIPKVTCTFKSANGKRTKITIYGYNNNRRDRFTHQIIRDYIKWFTRGGSIEWIFNHLNERRINISFKGLNEQEYETFESLHEFGKESITIGKLFDKYTVKAPEYYCKHVVKKDGNLKNSPEISYDAIFSIEGNQIKYSYNNMIRRGGYSAPEGAYKVQDRYGLWLCKDYIPIQRMNDWLPTLKTEWTRLHAFINCQEFHLTANRGSVENTPSEIMTDLRNEIEDIYDEIVSSDIWQELQWLENESIVYNTQEREEAHYKRRCAQINKANVCKYGDLLLIEPKRETGVFSLYMQLSVVQQDLFPFKVLDYDTHEGIDVIVKESNNNPISSTKLRYVEFKYLLEKDFNHSFENLNSVVCWDTNVKHDEEVNFLETETRKMSISGPDSVGDYTHYFLDHPKKPYRIEVFVLKDYLREKLGLEFRPRSQDAIE